MLKRCMMHHTVNDLPMLRLDLMTVECCQNATTGHAGPCMAPNICSKVASSNEIVSLPPQEKTSANYGWYHNLLQRISTPSSRRRLGDHIYSAVFPCHHHHHHPCRARVHPRGRPDAFARPGAPRALCRGPRKAPPRF